MERVIGAPGMPPPRRWLAGSLLDPRTIDDEGGEDRPLEEPIGYIVDGVRRGEEK